MAVDANVIIFARIREEIATGKTVKSSIKIGFQKALSAILDGNITTLIAAAVLGFMGSGTVKGFAQTLAPVSYTHLRNPAADIGFSPEKKEKYKN